MGTRDFYIDIIRKSCIGPGATEDIFNTDIEKEILMSSPYEQYYSGILFPSIGEIEILPELNKKFPNMKLVLAGDICQIVGPQKNCIRIGFVDNIRHAYDAADIVVNPVPYGTGLKIKNIEAIGYCKPLVTTPAGAEGIEQGIENAFLVAESEEQFVDAITRIFTDKDLYDRLTENAYEFAKSWNQCSEQALNEVLGI